MHFFLSCSCAAVTVLLPHSAEISWQASCPDSCSSAARAPVCVHSSNAFVASSHFSTFLYLVRPAQNTAVIIALEYGILQAVVHQSGGQVTAAKLSKETGADKNIVGE